MPGLCLDGRPGLCNSRDVRLLYYNVLEHRITPDPQARMSDRNAHTLLTEVLESVPAPKVVGKSAFCAVET